MRLRLFVGALVAASVAPTTAALAVEGGGFDTTTVHAVAIATGGPANPSLRCSGVLISTNVVLTARHCLSKLPGDGSNCAKSFGEPLVKPRDLFITTRPRLEPGTHWRNVISWELPEPTALCGNDIAALVVEGAFDRSEATPARPALDAAELEAILGARVFGMAGFGATSPLGSDGGQRRSRFDIPVKCVPGVAGFECDGALEYIDTSEITGGAGPCSGDSGGAAIAERDRGVVFGILSRGSRGDDTCSEGIFQRTDVWRWLIAKTVLRATPPGTSPPAWASAALPVSPKVGELCLGVGACGSDAECVSLDGRRSFVCARRCEKGCATGERCDNAVCIPGDPPVATSGCEITERRPASRVLGIVAVQIAALLGLGLRRRRGARRH